MVEPVKHMDRLREVRERCMGGAAFQGKRKLPRKIWGVPQRGGNP